MISGHVVTGIMMKQVLISGKDLELCANNATNVYVDCQLLTVVRTLISGHSVTAVCCHLMFSFVAFN